MGVGEIVVVAICAVVVVAGIATLIVRAKNRRRNG